MLVGVVLLFAGQCLAAEVSLCLSSVLPALYGSAYCMHINTKREWLIVVMWHERQLLLLATMPQKLLIFRSLKYILADSHAFAALPAVSHHHWTDRIRWRVFQRLSERSFCGLHQQWHQQQHQLHRCKHEPVS